MSTREAITISSPSSTVLVNVLEGAAVQIWMNRADKMNALDVELADSLLLVIERAIAAGASALLLRGKGRGFCAGADLRMRQTMTAEQRYAHNRSLNAIANALEAAPIPTVAVINGAALGGGLELALACDMRIASESAQLGLTETKVGAIPGAGGTQRLPRLIGVSHALKMMYLAEPVTARQAYQLGLVNDCVAHDELDHKVSALAITLGRRSPAVARTLKQVVKAGMSVALDAGLELERAALVDILGSKDYAEGLAAFAEKREPNFKRGVPGNG